jgi:hypothetical protein
VFCSPLVAQPRAPMATPSEGVGDESAGETARSGDQDPIPLGFVALSQEPRSSHGQDVEVGGGFAGSRRAPSRALHVGLARSNSGRGLPGRRGLEASERGLGAGGRGPGADERAPGGAGIGGRGLGLSGMAIDGMGGNGVGDSLALVTCSTICLTLVAANSCNALKSLASCSVL